MKERLPVLKAKDVIKVLRRLGFYEVRQKGAHVCFKNSDGRFTLASALGRTPRSGRSRGEPPTVLDGFHAFIYRKGIVNPHPIARVPHEIESDFAPLRGVPAGQASPRTWVTRRSGLGRRTWK